MFLIIIGVTGCGKSSVGAGLAEKLNWKFFDADDFHSAENIAKMSTGLPLTDQDRASWLEDLKNLIRVQTEQGIDGVLACSALKNAYRIILAQGGPVKFVYLKGTPQLISQRIARRSGHFMRPELLASQFESLEEPMDALTIDIDQELERIIEKITEEIMLKKYTLGMIGLGVMGRSLALNFQRNGITTLGYDLRPQLSQETELPVAESLQELADSLTKPRVFFLMVPAGDAVDSAIKDLRPFLQTGDILIDGGNSHFKDTERRVISLQAQGIHFVGTGVSGGQSGALWGPSIMPGGDSQAWAAIREILTKISAKTPQGEACVNWMGKGGAGHFVKMIHNGIEYADMQLIAEIYDLFHRGAGLSNQQIASIFGNWNKGKLRSYLIEITAQILTKIDPDTGRDLVDLIVDQASQKGTGIWTSQNALDLGVAIPTINAAVEARIISSMKSERIFANKILGGNSPFEGNLDALTQHAEAALYASKVTSYAQGFYQLKSASAEFGWDLNLEEIAKVWRAGCIIRASILDDFAAAFEQNPLLSNLLIHPTFSQAIMERQEGWRVTLQTGIGLGIPMPAMAASLAYFDAYRSETLPANLTQAQRDFFGAHTYQRLDRPGVFHTKWEG